MRKLSFMLTLPFLAFSGYAQYQVQVDFSTGVNNTNQSLIPVLNSDDTWQVDVPPINGVFNPVPVTTGILVGGAGTWDSEPCARWISPFVDANGNVTQAPTANDSYVYRMQFTKAAAQCPVTGPHRIVISYIGADNSITGLRINGTNYTAPTAIHNPLSGAQTININPADIWTGLNTVELTVHNLGAWTGLFICGYLEYPMPNTSSITPMTIYGSANRCSSDGLTFNGNVIGTASTHFWKIEECLANGSLVTGGYSFTGPVTNGNPGSYTFPNTIQCGKYYKVTLVASNSCQSFTTSKVICYACNKPDFSLSNNTSDPTYYTLAATPNEQGPFGPCGTFGYAWYVEDITGSPSPYVLIDNPSSWWGFQTSFVNATNHFKDLDCTTGYNGTYNSLPAGPANGKFLYDHTYRITRGTWVNNSICGWQQYAQTITVTPGRSADGASGYITLIEEDRNAPDMSGLFAFDQYDQEVSTGLSLNEKPFIYPNPNNGEFSINIPASTHAGTISVTDVYGRVVYTQPIVMEQGAGLVKISCAHLPKGIYLVKIGGHKEALKMVVAE